MRFPHIKTLLSLVATAGAMVGLLAAKTSAHSLALSHKEPPAATEILTGPPISITHGIVRVRITMAGGHIIRVAAVNLPHDNDVSWMRSETAATVLAREVMAAQSAHVDAVSGATYTSAAYLKSLQAAIDAAKT